MKFLINFVILSKLNFKIMVHIKPLREKAYLYIALFFVIIIAASFLIGCGSDTITNNGTVPTENLIFSFDSASIRTSFIGQQTIYRDDTIPVIFDSCKITFETYSNCDSQSSIQLKVIDSSMIAFIRNIHTFNELYVTYDKAKISKQLKIFKLALHIDNTTNGEKYILIKNFKVYKIN